MHIFKTTLLAVAALFCATSASAQEAAHCDNACCAEAQALGYKPYPYNFVQLQGGLGTTFTNKSFTDLLSPTASVGVGRFFAPAVGARLHINAWESKGGFRTIDDTYKFNYLNTNADVLLNLTNLFSKKNNHLLNVILVGGIGLNYAWNNDDLTNLLDNPAAVQPGESTANAWGDGRTRKSLLSHNLRAGLLFDVNVCKNWNVGLEIDANSLDDRFNSKYNNSDDWMMTAQLSVTFKFGHKAVKPLPQPPVIPVIQPEPEPEPVVVAEPEPEPEPEPIPLGELVNYEIRKSTPVPDEVVAKVAQWAKDNPDKTIVVKGYADKGTGNPQLNQGYSEERANHITKLLIQAGVPAERIETHAYGDTVQPYPNDNDKNRCVIIEGK